MGIREVNAREGYVSCSISWSYTMADAAGMMYSIYVTSVIRYDSFVALASKNARKSPVAGSSSTIVPPAVRTWCSELNVILQY